MSAQRKLGKINGEARSRRRLTPVRVLLPLGWLLAAVGYFGPWIAHPTAALTLSGVDMGEFVKFLPGVLDGSLKVTRQLFYLPPWTVAVTVALLAGSRRLRYPRLLQVAFVLLAVPVSLQLLPPAWSPASLLTPEFRLQTVALGFSWLLLASFRPLGRWLAPRLAGALSAILALLAALLAAWQFWIVKPAIDQVYRRPPPVGWGLGLCLAGLAILAVAGAILALRARPRSGGYGL